MWDKDDESPAFAAIKGDVYCSVGVNYPEERPGIALR